MEVEEWLTWYDRIRSRFGYSIVEDQNAAVLLSQMLEGRDRSIKDLKELIENRDVIVAGAGPSIENARKLGTVIAADGAAQALIENDIKPSIVVTDLDGNHEYLLKADRLGAIMVVHAHGDNINLIRNLVPKMKNCIGTTQVKPLHNIYNFGGFTDGDRAVFLADALNARSIILIGMDFGTKVGRYSQGKDERLKIEKMKVGKELLEHLARSSRARLYNASSSIIAGFKNILIEDVADIIRGV